MFLWLLHQSVTVQIRRGEDDNAIPATAAIVRNGNCNGASGGAGPSEVRNFDGFRVLGICTAVLGQHAVRDAVLSVCKEVHISWRPCEPHDVWHEAQSLPKPFELESKSLTGDHSGFEVCRHSGIADYHRDRQGKAADPHCTSIVYHHQRALQTTAHSANHLATKEYLK